MRNSLAIVAAFMPLCAVAACSQSEDGTTLDRKRHPDAAVVTPPDAAASSSGGAGVVSCYTEGNPAQTCTLPTACCFSNYSSQHDGACSNAACAYGTIDCDGPEDCATGQHCCSHALRATDGTVSGYMLSCQANACGSAPGDHELCHSSATCAAGATCVTAYGNANDLPRTLDICR